MDIKHELHFLLVSCNLYSNKHSPHFLKCSYEDKNQKELIINKRVLAIYHKRYNKIYRYPLSKSYFLEILNGDKFSEVVMKGEMQINNNFSEIQYLDEKFNGNNGTI